jgi:hypothetical protein
MLEMDVNWIVQLSRGARQLPFSAASDHGRLAIIGNVWSTANTDSVSDSAVINRVRGVEAKTQLDLSLGDRQMPVNDATWSGKFGKFGRSFQ